MLTREQISLITNGNNLAAYQVAVKKGEISIHNVTKKGETALFNAGVEKAKYLLSKGVYVNQLNNQRNLALIEYIDKKSNIYYSEEKKQMINIFFEYGLNTILYKENLERFVKNSDDDEHEVLEKFDLLNYLSTDNLKKAYNENRELFENHIGRTSYNEMSPLFHADKKGKEFLLSIGLNANAVNLHGENAAFYVKNEKELDLLINSGLIINSHQTNRFNENFYYNVCRNLLHSLSKKEKENTYPTIIKIINYIKINLPEVNLLDFNNYTPDVKEESYCLELLIDVGYFEYAKNKFPENYQDNLSKAILGLVNNKKLEKILKYLELSRFENLEVNNKTISRVLLLNSPYNFIKALPYMSNLPEGEEALMLFHKFTTTYYNNTCKIKITPKEFKTFFEYIKININIDFTYNKKNNALLENIIDSTLSNGEVLSIIEKELKIDLKQELREYSSNYLLGKTTSKNIDYFYDAGIDYFKDPESIEIMQSREDMHFILEFITKKEKEILTEKLKDDKLNDGINKKRI